MDALAIDVNEHDTDALARAVEVIARPGHTACSSSVRMPAQQHHHMADSAMLFSGGAGCHLLSVGVNRAGAENACARRSWWRAFADRYVGKVMAEDVPPSASPAPRKDGVEESAEGLPASCGGRYGAVRAPPSCSGAPTQAKKKQPDITSIHSFQAKRPWQPATSSPRQRRIPTAAPMRGPAAQARQPRNLKSLPRLVQCYTSVGSPMPSPSSNIRCT